LEQHGKLIRRVKLAHRKCLEKGWWKTGERKRVKGRYEHFVWERREREQDNGAGAEKVEETDEGPAGKAEDIDSEKFWVPYQNPSTQSLKTFLRALPSGQYYDIEKCMVATDGSLRLRRKKEEGETMGAGVAWQQEANIHRERENPPEGKGINGTPREERGSRRQKEEELQSVSRRVAQLVKHKGGAGSNSSGSQDRQSRGPIEMDLVILIDSAAAIRRLTWFRRKDPVEFHAFSTILPCGGYASVLAPPHTSAPMLVRGNGVEKHLSKMPRDKLPQTIYHIVAAWRLSTVREH
jgi:hypothetical protein